jgi:hypothetical protein
MREIKEKSQQACRAQAKPARANDEGRRADESPVNGWLSSDRRPSPFSAASGRGGEPQSYVPWDLPDLPDLPVNQSSLISLIFL